MKNLTLKILAVLLGATCLHPQLFAYAQELNPYEAIGYGRHLRDYPALYMRGLAGVNFAAALKDKTDEGTARIDLSPGFAIGLAAGVHLQRAFRIEAEMVYRHNGFDKIQFPEGTLEVRGDYNNVVFASNALIDLPFGCFTPYFGAGMGARLVTHRIKPPGPSLPNQEIVFKDNGFVYQVLAGLMYSLSPNNDCGLEYRFLSDKNRINNHALLGTIKVRF